MKRLTRSVGYCLQEKCEEYARGCFLLSQDRYYCNTCRHKGLMMTEHGTFTSNHEVFREVRVEYDYDPIQKKYKCIAILADEGMDEGDVYTLFSPLIKTDKRALKVAEGLLATLSYSLPEEGAVPTHTEQTLDLNSPLAEFVQQLGQHAKRWRQSSLAKRGTA